MRKLSGLRAWAVQRLTAVYIASYIIFLIVFFILHDDIRYQQWTAWMASPLLAVSLTVFVLFLLLHAWIGMRDIFIDYIHSVWLRAGCLAALALSLLAAGVWFLVVLMKVVVSS